MIMAVSLTVLLAIIGSSFVLTSRMDRQGVRGIADAKVADTALNATLKAIQTLLAEDVVNPVTGDFLVRPLDRAGRGFDVNNDGQIDATEQALSSDPWLAPIEPVNTGTQTSPVYVWPVTSEIFQPVPQALPVTVVNPRAPIMDGSPADSDGDGMADAYWRRLVGLESTGKDVFVAVRIIDNCALINLNTAGKMLAARVANDYAIRPTSPFELERVANSFGEYLTQVNLEMLLQRPRPNVKTLKAADLVNNVLNLRTSGYVGQNETQRLAWYNQRLLTQYDEAATLGILDTGGANPFVLSLYGIEDEMELRNRFCINTPATTRLESQAALEDAIGLYDITKPLTKFRIVPFSAVDGGGAAVQKWYNYLTAENLRANEWADQRHLFTGYSFDRDVRLRPPSADVNNPDNLLDGPLGVGKWRKVNVNQVLTRWMDWRANLADNARRTMALRGAYRLVKAVEAAYPTTAGYSADVGVQFFANLVDYIDADNLPTAIPAGFLGTNLPSKVVFGVERQPFITEVCHTLTKQLDGPRSEAAAIELYNPYDTNLVLGQGWELHYNGALLIPLNKDGNNVVIPAGGKVVYQTGTSFNVRTGPAVAEVRNVAAFKLDPKAEEGKKIIEIRRPTVLPDGTPVSMIVDAVWGSDVAKLLDDSQASADKAQTNVIWRGQGVAPQTRQVVLAPWSWTRNEFSERLSAPKLGQWDKVVTAKDRLNRRGIAIPVADRGPTLMNGDAGRPVWQVHGWYELGRILLVGNTPTPNELLTDQIAKQMKEDLFTDADLDNVFNVSNGDTFNAAAFPVGDDLNANGRYDYPDEGRLRVNFMTAESFTDLNGDGFYTNGEPVADVDGSGIRNTGLGNRGAELMKRLSLLSFADDGSDAVASLEECRVPGRLNLNTMPKAVFKALVPMLTQLDNTRKVGKNGETALQLYADELALAFAARQKTAPFTSVNEFLDFIDSYSSLTAQGALNRAQYFRARIWPSVQKFSDEEADFEVGDRYLRADFEDRDWVFTRLANLLTVRSDTFTAYIAVRVQNQVNPAELVERRIVATLDRSNVYLPAARARNVGGTETWTDVNKNGVYEFGTDTFTDANVNGVLDDDSGERAIGILRARAAGLGQLEAQLQSQDPDYYDRQFVSPKIVAVRQVPDPR